MNGIDASGGFAARLSGAWCLFCMHVNGLIAASVPPFEFKDIK